MRNKKHIGGIAVSIDPFIRSAGPVKHPRRDEEGHSAGAKTDDGKTPVIKTGGKAEDGKAGEGEKASPEKTADHQAAEKAAKDEKKRADDLAAALEAERDKHRTDDEKAVQAQTKKAVEDAVAAKEVELTDSYETKIVKLQGQLVDSTIKAALATVGRKVEDFKVVLSTLDKTQFVDYDGAVKTDAVTAWASELASSSSAKPPRTGTGSTRSGSSDRGFGRYLQSK